MRYSWSAPFLYPLKTQENLWFSGIFREYKMRTLTRNRLSKTKKSSCICELLCLPKKTLKENDCFTIKHFTKIRNFLEQLRRKLKKSDFLSCVCLKNSNLNLQIKLQQKHQQISCNFHFVFPRI